MDIVAAQVPVPVPIPAPVTPDWRILGYGLIAGLALTAAFVVMTARLARSAQYVELPGGAQWKFTDSWASNLTALTAGFAGLIAAFSGKLDSVLMPSTTISFVVSSALYVTIAACAPILYTAGQAPTTTTKDNSTITGLSGTPFGLISAATLTMLSVFSSLASFFCVLNIGAKGTIRNYLWPADIALIGIAALVGIYGVRTIRWLLSPRTENAVLPGITSVSCCETAHVVFHRFSLL